MKLTKLILKNFCGYRHEVVIDFGNITTFVGKNDCGKSTILEALDIFFNDNKNVVKETLIKSPLLQISVIHKRFQLKNCKYLTGKCKFRTFQPYFSLFLHIFRILGALIPQWRVQNSLCK